MNEKVKLLMANVFRTDIKNITDDLTQKNVTFWDSLRHLNLIVELEEKFEVSFEPEEISEMITFKKVIYFLNQKISKK
jgi:acyl carrier protein